MTNRFSGDSFHLQNTHIHRMLLFLDILLSILHLSLVGFNLLGWIWRRTRRAHLATILLTAASWFILGIWYGIGYCPITDWQWQVKRQLGESNLPASFIKYFADKTFNASFSPELVNILTVVFFFAALIASIIANVVVWRKAARSTR